MGLSKLKWPVKPKNTWKSCKMFPTPTLEAVGVFNGKCSDEGGFHGSKKPCNALMDIFFRNNKGPTVPTICSKITTSSTWCDV